MGSGEPRPTPSGRGIPARRRLLLAPHPGRLRRRVAPEAAASILGLDLRRLVACPSFRELLAGVVAVPPRQAVLHLFQADVPAVEEHVADVATESVALVAAGGDVSTVNQAREVLFRRCAEWLRFLGRVDPRDANAALNPPPVQDGHSVPIVDGHDSTVDVMSARSAREREQRRERGRMTKA